MNTRNVLRLALCASVVAITLPASAQSFAQLHTDRTVKPVPMTGGLVFSNGTVFAGSHFTVKVVGTGSYQVTFAKGLFASIPVFSCLPYGSATPTPICVNTSTAWKSAGETKAVFQLLDPSGNFINASFEFTAIAINDKVSH